MDSHIAVVNVVVAAAAVVGQKGKQSIVGLERSVARASPNWVSTGRRRFVAAVTVIADNWCADAAAVVVVAVTTVAVVVAVGFGTVAVVS